MPGRTREDRLGAGAPSQTALHVARLRAAHQLLDQPLVLNDPFALRILGPRAEAELQRDAFKHDDALSRALRATVVVRSRFAEDDVARAVLQGVRQVVVLGAGLDTFAYRHPHAAQQLRIFEVDHPATQHWKRQALDAAGIACPAELSFAAVDFEHQSLAHGLAEVGFRCDQAACFSWLGVTMYLSQAAIMDTLGWVAQLPQGSCITLDFRVPPDMLDPIERVAAAQMAARAAAVGEPWMATFAPADLCQQVLALGFSAVQAYAPDALTARYLARRADGLRTRGHLLWAQV